MPTMNDYLVISALGKDKPGIVDRLTREILEQECNVSDSRMTVLGGEFAIILLVQGAWNQLTKLESHLTDQQDNLDLTIHFKRTEERQNREQLLPYTVEVIALDHPGIVYSLANFFSRLGINIEDMNTSSYAAPHTGTPMFAVEMSVGIPTNLQIAAIREEFMEFCDTMNLDAVLEPMKP